MLSLLATRRSLPLRFLAGPVPDAAESRRMLVLAARVPDQDRLVPWRFILFEGEARWPWANASMWSTRGRTRTCPRARRACGRVTWRVPLLVVVVSRPDRQSKVPEWNQVLSAGAVCMNLIAAATAMGFAADWLLKWPARDHEAFAVLGVGEGERVAGFMHIGRPAERPRDRARPDLRRIVTSWAAAG